MSRQKGGAPKHLNLNLGEFGENLKFQMVDPKRLKIDRSYQRDENDLVEFIGDNFNPLAFCVAVVAERENGELYLVDSQQRTKGAIRASKKLVPCVIHQSAGRQDEAKLFQFLNLFRKAVTAIEIFNAGLTAGDENAIALNKAVEDAGFKIARKRTVRKRWPYISAIEQLRMIHKQGGPEAITNMLALISMVWDGEYDALRREILRGMYLLYRSYGVTFNADRFKKRMKGIPVATIMSDATTMQARARRDGASLQMYQAVFSVLRKKYGLKVPDKSVAWPKAERNEDAEE